MSGRPEPDFSLSGLKTAIRLEAEKIAPISRQDIAKMVGASREMVSRVMKDLEDRGFIETREDGSMLIKDRLTTLG